MPKGIQPPKGSQPQSRSRPASSSSQATSANKPSLSSTQDKSEQARPRLEHQRIVSALRTLAVSTAAQQRSEKIRKEYKAYIAAKPHPPALPSPPTQSQRVLLYSFETNVPFRLSKEANTLLRDLTTEQGSWSVEFPKSAVGDQDIFCRGKGKGQTRKKLGRVTHVVQTEAQRTNVKYQGISVEADEAGRSLIVAFKYPALPATVRSRRNAAQGDLTFRLRSFLRLHSALQTKE